MTTLYAIKGPDGRYLTAYKSETDEYNFYNLSWCSGDDVPVLHSDKSTFDRWIAAARVGQETYDSIMDHNLRREMAQASIVEVTLQEVT